jgi:hypothetical protein
LSYHGQLTSTFRKSKVSNFSIGNENSLIQIQTTDLYEEKEWYAMHLSKNDYIEGKQHERHILTYNSQILQSNSYPEEF